MSVRLQRHLSSLYSLQPGQWTDETPTGKPAVCCPSCGQVSDLDAYTVRGGGILTPIWSCPYVCPAIEFLTLADWDEAVLR